MNAKQESVAAKRGFLDNNFHFFDLQDSRELHIESHYHDFYKIVIFLSGKVTYYIDGASYDLRPWDILLINRDTMHKPAVDTSTPYKRIILWLKPAFLAELGDKQTDLSACFILSAQNRFHLLRTASTTTVLIQAILSQLSDASQSRYSDDELLCRALLTQFLIYLNRQSSTSATDFASTPNEHPNAEIYKILQYIDTHLADDLAIENLARRFFFSRYYLMRKFKQQTGYSVHQYILQKRLIAANQLLRTGLPVMTVCLECGFRDYANFARAFKKQYNVVPSRISM